MDKTALSPIPDKAVTAKINKLREQRKEAIKNHEFLQAQEIDKEIAKIKLDVIDNQKKIILRDFDQKIRKDIEVFNEAMEKLEINFDEQIHAIRVRYHRFFTDTQLSQKTELLNAEREYKDSISRENLRKIPECEKKMELSRKAATNGQYEEAIALKAEAAQISKENLDERIQAVDREFIDKREKLLLQFGKVMKQLASKFEVDLSSIDKKRNQAIEKEKENRTSQIQSTYSRCKLKLVQSGAVKDSITASKILVADLREILGELGCPMPKEIGADIPSSNPGSPTANYSMKNETTDKE